MLPSRSPDQRRADVREGVRTGIRYAIGLSVVATAAIAIGLAKGAAGQAALIWIAAIAFYFIAGVLGGALYGLLRPARDKLWGRLVTAYLLLFLVYGGGTLGFWPLFMSVDPTFKRVPVLLVVGVWAGLSLILAPAYVFMFWVRSRL